MKFFSLLWHDISNGIFRQWKFLIVPLVFISFAFQCHTYITLNFSGTNSLSGTWLDYIIFCFKGMEPFAPNNGKDYFQFPVMWLICIGFCSYITSDYPISDLTTFGQQVIIRATSRSRWWFSKCCWNICCSLSYFILGLVAVTVFCLLTNIPLVLQNTESITEVLFAGLGEKLTDNLAFDPFECLIVVILSPLLFLIALNLLQMLLSLFIRPIFSFLISASILILSAFFNNPFAIGNYAMIMRNERVLESGINSITGLFIHTILIVISIIVGMIRFKHYDILIQEVV